MSVYSEIFKVVLNFDYEVPEIIKTHAGSYIGNICF